MNWHNIRMFFKTLFKRRLAVVLISLAGVMLIAAAIAGYIIYHQGEIAADNAQKLLEEYKQSISTVETEETAGLSTPIQQASDELVPSPIQTPIHKTYEGYKVLGTIMIDKLGLELPVISETSNAALKVSCCYYQGAMPGEDGNMVITGHNYADGSIFGKIDQLKTGDEIILYTQFGTYTYYVDGTEVIKPDDTDALDEYKGSMALTLMTCTSHGNRRLIVRCCISDD